MVNGRYYVIFDCIRLLIEMDEATNSNIYPWRLAAVKVKRKKNAHEQSSQRDQYGDIWTAARFA